jgi:diaminopimelate epimerase
MRFWKYSALGNTFVVVSRITGVRSPHLGWVRDLCSLSSGVGADGVAIIQSGKRRVHIYNADGTRAELSGNGVRAAAAWLFGPGGRRTKDVVLLTDAGPIPCVILSRQNIRVTLPPPVFEAEHIPAITRAPEVWGVSVVVPTYSRKAFKVYALSLGNPQCVVWCPRFPRDWEKLGEALHQHRLFPAKTNVVFARSDTKAIEVKLWERGVGVTLASGTGAAAALVAGVRLAKAKRRSRVRMDGGTMQVSWTSSGTIDLTAPVHLVAEGTWSGRS